MQEGHCSGLNRTLTHIPNRKTNNHTMDVAGATFFHSLHHLLTSTISLPPSLSRTFAFPSRDPGDRSLLSFDWYPKLRVQDRPTQQPPTAIRMPGGNELGKSRSSSNKETTQPASHQWISQGPPLSTLEIFSPFTNTISLRPSSSRTFVFSSPVPVSSSFILPSGTRS